MNRTPRSTLSFSVLSLVVFMLASNTLATAQTYDSLYSFQGGIDGWNPLGFLIADKAGNLYGTTTYGGIENEYCNSNGCGTVFQLQPPAKAGDPWIKTTLYSFNGSPDDGALPGAEHMVFDEAGNLYGTTLQGGSGLYGTVFELSPPAEAGGSWTETILYNFTDGEDGGVPANGLTRDAAGNLYGTTNDGGQYGQKGVGTIFQLTPPQVQGDAWTETTLYSFQVIKDGDEPNEVVLDAKGNLYGSRSADNILCTPSSPEHCGTAFKLQRQGTSWRLITLHQFEGLSDGSSPNGMILGPDGNLYGTTSGFGGNTSDLGTVFELSPPASGNGPWTETLLYTFSGSADGGSPASEPIFDSKGNLYGTTFYGGDGNCNLGLGCGVVYALAPPAQQGSPWTETVLHTFGEGSDGADPVAGLIWGKGRLLYGAASGGGGSAACNGGCGTVFEVAP